MPVCKISMGLQKQQFDKIMPILSGNIIGLWVACVCQVMVALGNLLALKKLQSQLATALLIT